MFHIIYGELYIDDVKVPAKCVSEDTNFGDGMFFSNRGALISFDNNLELSIIWNSLSLSDNNRHGMTSSAIPFEENPERVEIAVLKDGKWILEHQVVGYCDSYYVFKVMYLLMTQGHSENLAYMIDSLQKS